MSRVAQRRCLEGETASKSSVSRRVLAASDQRRSICLLSGSPFGAKWPIRHTSSACSSITGAHSTVYQWLHITDQGIHEQVCFEPFRGPSSNISPIWWTGLCVTAGLQTRWTTINVPYTTSSALVFWIWQALMTWSWTFSKHISRSQHAHECMGTPTVVGLRWHLHSSNVVCTKLCSS